MITPAFSPTATERVLPRLALDFTTETLDPRVTVTRALNTATRFNSSGYIEVVNANLPRFDFNPVTKVCRGLLIEETRTNLLLQSGNLNTSWTSDGGATMATNVTTSPDGTVDASQLQFGTVKYRYQNVSTGVGTVYSYSIFAKLGTGGNNVVSITAGAVGATFNLVTLVVGSVTATSANLTDVGNGWFRCNIIFTGATTSTSIGFDMRGTFAVGQGHYFYGGQLEAGAFATSYIPTTTGTVARNADVVTMTGTNFTSWYNTTAGCFVAEASSFGNAVTRGIVGNSPTGFASYIRSTTAGAIFDGSNVTATANTITAGVTFRLATAYTATTFAACLNAGTVATGATNGALSSSTSIAIGSTGAASFLNGYVAKLNYYPQRLTNAEMQAFSK